MSYSLHRRAFLVSTLAFSVKPSFRFPTDIRHRLSVSTYPFRDGIGAGKLSLAQFAAGVVEKFNVFGIEPWSRHFESIEPAYLSSLAAAFQSAGLQVVNIPCDVNVKLCGTAEQRSTALATYYKWVDAAVMLKSPSIRVHCPEDTACAVEGLRALATYGASKNVVVNLENDEPGSEDPAHILKVLQMANTPYLRALPDFGNSLLIREDQDYNAGALAPLFARAYNISHVKDVLVDKGHRYVVDMGRVFAAARKAHYRGFFSMESESDKEPYENTRLLIAAALKNLA